MNKKIVWILGGLLGLIIIVGGIIVFLKNNTAKSPQTANTQQTSTTQQTGQTGSTQTQQTTTQPTPTQTAADMHKISDSPAIAPAFSYDGQTIWYFTSDGHLYRLNPASGIKQEYLLPQSLTIDDGIWPAQGDDFIVVSGTGTAKIFRYYDSSAKSFINYPANVKEVDFMPNGQQVVYNWVSGTTSELSIAAKDLSGHKTVATLPQADLTTKVSPLGDRAFAYDNSNPQSGKLYYINFTTKKVTTLPTSLENDAIWAPDGRHFVYNRNPGGKASNGDLWLGDIDAGTDVDLHIASKVSKAVFDGSGNNLYVAAQTVDGLSEEVWKINLSTMSKTKVFTPADNDPAINSSHLLISSDGATLYFLNSDGYIYSVQLH
ncbi:PD40 domain-containing protein [Patescibacteria group bacterium]|nr:PD40 domain-containing protein [Patescibacteria group bacterium]